MDKRINFKEQKIKTLSEEKYLIKSIKKIRFKYEVI